MQNFKGFIVREEGSEIKAELETLSLADLSEGNVVIKVEYSSLNYKDMLAFQKNGGVIRNYPQIPGIDLAGTVLNSKDPQFKKGDQVLGAGYGLGVDHTGGLSEIARVPGKWLTKLPDTMTTRTAMTFGTAGLTAGLSIDALLKAGMKPADEVLVTGATGGVGSIAVAILKQMGYQNLTALVRKQNQVEIARKLGADATLDANTLKNGKPMQHQIFDHVLDTVGGDVAASLLSMVKVGGAMSMCGNAGGNQLKTSVLPFILRGISLLGIDSITPPAKVQDRVWQKLATDWDVSEQLVVDEISLSDTLSVIQKLKEGQHLGRTIVKVQ
ncbi:acryloyl-CoA reductase [Ligilactobacillus pobuzihii]|uniref:YhdH/YhfP family quinone oxidoreductase n=1 Tax=Ligilactobacillus pobuzihii TaxID=449659 RepID=UPI0019CF54C4|nr:YhdH/YhfP family quinone oxidoreductase [Ligilactobacillus pobuzihii]MBN7274503.1 acryloyl-CoA reductase [Ligilactobacillus pobuzihii]